MQATQATDQDWNLTDDDAAELFGTSGKTISRWRKLGQRNANGEVVKLACVKVRGIVRTSRAALLEFVRAVNAPATGEPIRTAAPPAGTGEAGELAADQGYDADGVV